LLFAARRGRRALQCVILGKLIGCKSKKIKKIINYSQKLLHYLQIHIIIYIMKIYIIPRVKCEEKGFTVFCAVYINDYREKDNKIWREI